MAESIFQGTSTLPLWQGVAALWGAERAVVPAAAAHRLPVEYDDLAAAPLLCAGVIGYRALRVSGIQPGQRLGLYGFGASAHIAIQVAVHQGCEVFVFTRSEAHRRLARDLGASWTGAAADEPPARCQAAITFAPAGWLVREALRVLDRGGTVAINAIHMNAVPELDYATHLYWERGIRSVANATHRDARDFLALAGEIPLRTTVQGVPLASANEVLRRLARSELDAAAALVPTAE